MTTSKAPTIDQLNKQFAVAGVVKIEPGSGGLPMVVVTTKVASAHVYLHGAHVAHYQRTDEPPILYMDKQSSFEEGKPIRGGVPVIFPWFGPHPTDASLPAHGLVRLRSWNLNSVKQLPHDAVSIEFGFKSDPETKKAWPYDFELTFTVVVGKTLSMSLAIKNTSDKVFTCENALHTYFHVADIRNVTISGLENVSYLSKVEGNKVVHVGDVPITFTCETDRAYLNTRDVCVIKDPGLNRHILVEKEDSLVTVVWNPWIAKAKAMPDFTDDAWPGMVCVEAANSLFSAMTLVPGETRTLRQIVH